MQASLGIKHWSLTCRTLVPRTSNNPAIWHISLGTILEYSRGVRYSTTIAQESRGKRELASGTVIAIRNVKMPSRPKKLIIASSQYFGKNMGDMCTWSAVWISNLALMQGSVHTWPRAAPGHGRKWRPGSPPPAPPGSGCAPGPTSQPATPVAAAHVRELHSTTKLRGHLL